MLDDGRIRRNIVRITDSGDLVDKEVMKIISREVRRGLLMSSTHQLVDRLPHLSQIESLAFNGVAPKIRSLLPHQCAI
jgi:hypothetical protein